MLNVVHCPACSLKLHVPEDLLRKRVMCPTCGQTFDADSWVMEPDEPEAVSTSHSGAVVRPTEEYRNAPRQEPAARPQTGNQIGPEPLLVEPVVRPQAYQDPRAPHGSWEGPIHIRPTKVEAIGVMMLVGGIIALLFGIGGMRLHGLFHTSFWPPAIYSLILGVMAIVRGSRLLGRFGHLQPSPKVIAVMQIVNIINGDVPNLVMGIVSLSFLKDPGVRRYFRC